MTTIAMTFAFSGRPLPSELLAGLSILKTTHPELYIKAKLGTLTFDEVNVPLAFHVVPDERTKYIIEEGRFMWMYGLNVQGVPGDTIKAKFQEYRQSFRSDGPKLLLSIANTMDRLMPLTK